MNNRCKITGMGYYVPERRLTNFDLEKMVDTSDEWIIRRTGIKERRIAAEGMYSSDMAVAAAEQALASAGIGAEELDLVLVATTTPDMFTPNVSCMVQNRIGASNAAAIDLNTACTGFATALVIADQFIKTGYYRKILVIGAETISRMTDYKDRNTCILFGDGAGAVVVEASASDEGILSTEIGANGAPGMNLTSLAFKDDEKEIKKRISAKKQTLWMDGSEVLKFAVRTMAKATGDVVKKSGLAFDDIDLIIPHQANIRIVEGAAKRLGVGMDKMYINLDRYGNMGAASIPVALCEAAQSGRIKKGDTVVLVGFGGGLTWGAAVIKF